jgi:hypothetical protein
MGCLDGGALTAMSVLLKQGHTQSAVARLLGVTEGAVRYHRRRRTEGAVDGRSRQLGKAAAHAAATAQWRSSRGEGAINIAALHECLRCEHGYEGSLKSVQRYWARTFPAPAIRARRRVETPPGAQAWVDWAEFPGMVLALSVPLIARVHGIATAAGCQLVGACDLAIAANDARFAVSGINVGLFCSTPAVALSRNVPTKPAFEMLVTGEFTTAATAQA